MYILCTSYVHLMYILCTSYEHLMYILCTSLKKFILKIQEKRHNFERNKTIHVYVRTTKNQHCVSVSGIRLRHSNENYVEMTKLKSFF